MKTMIMLLGIATLFVLSFSSIVTAQPFLDCSEASIIACGETQTNSTPPGEPGAGNVSVWCDDDTYSYGDAWEFVYEFTLEDDSFVSIVMTYEHRSEGNDLDMSVRSICDERECLAYSVGVTGFEEINIDLGAGTYYIGIDGWNGYQDGSPHTMTLICEPVSVKAASWGALKALFR